MRVSLALGFIAGLVLLANPMEVRGQWTSSKINTRGMFGDRAFGQPLRPKPSTRFSASYWRGPSGNFLGRDATQRGMRFPAFRYESERQAPRTSRSWPEFAPIQPSEVDWPGEVASPPRVDQPSYQEAAPQIWFRGEAPPSESGAALEAPRPTRTVRPGVALGGFSSALAGTPAARTLQPSTSRATTIGLRSLGPVDESLSSALEARIAKIARFQAREPIRVSVAGGIATLQGTVSTQHDRKLVAELARMVPGVWDVNNQLTIEP